MKEIDNACLAILAAFREEVIQTGDINPTVVGLYTERKGVHITKVVDVPTNLIMKAIGITVAEEKTKGADEVVIGHTAWMGMIKIKDKTHPERSLPKNYQYGDLAKSSDKMEVLVGYRINLKTKKNSTVLWEIRRLGRKVEFQKMLVPEYFKSDILDSVL